MINTGKSLRKNDFGGSRASMNSNEIMVVEEVNDNEISSEAFMLIRQSKNSLANSVRTDSNSKAMGPLIDDPKLPQHTGSLVDPPAFVQRSSDKQQTSISSI